MWHDITNEQIESVVLAMIDQDGAAHFKSLGGNILCYWIPRAFPCDALNVTGLALDTALKTNQEWVARFQSERVVPVVEKMLASKSIIRYERWLERA